MKHKVFVYGTLRPGLGPTVIVPGKMYDLGSFPGIKLGEPGTNHTFVAEVIEVDDEGLARLDRYEGYDPDCPEHSLYLRKEYGDGFIYEYNSDMSHLDYLEEGDWLKHVNQPRGRAAGLGQ